MERNLQPFRKAPKPDYMGEEKRFAKKRGLRQTISSGRIGSIHADSYDRSYQYDNKGTDAWTFSVDSRMVRALRKSALTVGKVPILVVEFKRNGEKVVIVPEEEWFALVEEVRGKEDRSNSSSTKRRSRSRTR